MDSDPGSDDFPNIDVEPEVGVETSLTQDGGVKKTVLVRGVGFARPDPKSDCTVSYVGTFEDGSQFDASDSFTFCLGSEEVIKGWDVGVASMQRGEKALFIFSPEYAYGEKGFDSIPPVPPNAILRFEIELKGWSTDIDISGASDEGLRKRPLSGYNPDDYNPDHRFGTKVRYTVSDAEPPGSVPEGVDLIGTIGSGDIVMRAIERALRKVKAGETSRIRVEKGSAYHARRAADLSWTPVDPETPEVQFTLQLSEVLLEMKDHWSFDTFAEMQEHGEPFREMGNDHYRAGRFVMARKYYRHAADCYQGDFHIKDEAEKDALRAARETIALNHMAVALALRNYAEVYEKASLVFHGRTTITINVDGAPLSPRAHSVACLKALLRRGKAYHIEGSMPEAVNDFMTALDLIAIFNPERAQAPLPKSTEVASLKVEAEKLLAAAEAEIARQDRALRGKLKGRRLGALIGADDDPSAPAPAPSHAATEVQEQQQS